MRRALLLLVALLAAPAAAKPKLPPCAPKAAQLFISPMGEPFRARKDASYPVAAWFAGADADRDGKLSLAEAVADAERFFVRLDIDGDGEIVPEEVTHYERKVAPEIQLFTARGTGRAVERAEVARRDKKGPLPYGGPLGAGRWSLLNLPQPVAAADEDFNRGITRDEFRAAAKTRFLQLDKAGRGWLDLAALPMTPAQAAAVNCVAPRPPSTR